MFDREYIFYLMLKRLSGLRFKKNPRSAITGIPVNRVAKATAPHLVCMLAVLFMITYIPGLVLWLPNLLMP